MFLTSETIFLQPFPLVFQHNDLHVMLYFQGHPEYEAIEAMIQEKNNEENILRLILTRHDQSQVDFINKQSLVNKMFKERVAREVYFAEIKYQKEVKDNKPHIKIAFVTNKGENVVFDFYCAGQPSAKHGGLVDPERHAEKTSLPIMFRERSTLAGPKSKVEFNGISYKIPTKIWIPFFFKGMQGYLSEDFYLGVFRSVVDDINVLAIPSKFSPGSRWIYNAFSGKRNYEITDVSADRIIIKHENQIIYGHKTNGPIGIEKIIVNSGNLTKEKSQLHVNFSPTLPMMIELTNDNREVHFSLSLNNDQELVAGKVNVRRYDNFLDLLLQPERPSWAVKRPVLISLEQVENTIKLKSKII